MTRGALMYEELEELELARKKIKQLDERVQKNDELLKYVLSEWRWSLEVSSKFVNLSWNLTKLHDYSDLEDNWDCDGAKAFSKELIDLARGKIILLDTQPKVFPTMRESIQFEYEKEDGDYLEFEIYEDRIEVFRIIDEHEEEFKLSVDENLNKIVNEFHGINNEEG